MGQITAMLDIDFDEDRDGSTCHVVYFTDLIAVEDIGGVVLYCIGLGSRLFLFVVFLSVSLSFHLALCEYLSLSECLLLCLVRLDLILGDW